MHPGLPRLTHPAPPRRLRIQSEMAQNRFDHRPLEDGLDDLHFSASAALAAACARTGACCSTTSSLSFAFGANNPWFVQRGAANFAQRSCGDTELIKSIRGRGTSAASRSMNFGGL